MKKLIAVLFLFVFGLSAVCAAPKSSKESVVRTEIETKDGFILVGDFYPSKTKGKKMPLVIMLHSFGGKSSDWGTLPKKIVSGGNNVFALDLRGHGRSVYDANLAYRSYKYFTPKVWTKYPGDILSAIDYLRENYSKIDYNDIMFIGADLGANTAVLAANNFKNKPSKMVLISPAQNFKGLYIPVVIANFPKTTFLFMVSKADKHFYNEVNHLTKFVQSKYTLKTYPEGGSGTMLLKKNPNAYTEIYNFIYSITPAPQKPAATTTPAKK